MGDCEKDEVPMLSESRRQQDGEPMYPNFQNLLSRARSASVSIHMDSSEFYERDTHLMGHTGPLRSDRRNSYVMSGPLHIGNKSENFWHNYRKETKAENLLSPNGTGENDWTDYNHAGTNEHLLRSGQLGMCNDPYCTTCPTYFNSKASRQKVPIPSVIFDSKVWFACTVLANGTVVLSDAAFTSLFTKRRFRWTELTNKRAQCMNGFHSALYGDAKGWAEKFFSFLTPYIPGVMNPHTKIVQQWSQFFAISCLVAIFVDPLYFFLLSVKQMTTILVLFRSITDLICFFNMLLQFRLAYVAPESRVVGTGDLVDHPKTIALHYLKGYFLLDLFILLPLPQIIILFVLPRYLGLSGANYAKNLLRAAILIQYMPRLFRFLPLLIGQSPSGFIFESASANFVINLLTFMLSGHVAGSCWYLFGLQRVNQCLRNACHNSQINLCSRFIDCGHGDIEKFQQDPTWNSWKNNSDAIACFTSNGFSYGIYVQAVNLTTEGSFLTRYVYALFWGFQQISTLAGNQVPSYFVWEVLFTMGIIGLGLLLFALLIGNMQNFLQSLGRRRLEMQLRRRDVEQWMRHRRLPEDLRRKVREAERYNWAATRGVNEESLLEDLPEDLQRDIRRHLFKFLKKVRIFSLMDDTILDAICARLKQKTYIKDSKIINFGGPVEKMVFIVRGKLESIGEDGVVAPLSEGDACGEELLTWCLEHSSVNRDGKKIRFPGQRLISNRTVRCLTNVEAFSLRAADLEELTSHFARFLRNPHVLGAIRYESHYWRSLAAARIQVAWRYRKKRLQRAHSPQA